MVKVPEEIKTLISKQALPNFTGLPMATSDTSGTPNVIYVLSCWWSDDETLCVIDNFLNKTRKNLEANPKASFACWDQETGKSYQIKCDATVLTEGPLYEEGYKKAKAFNEDFPGNAVVACKVTDIYQALYGPGAGDKLY